MTLEDIYETPAWTITRTQYMTIACSVSAEMGASRLPKLPADFGACSACMANHFSLNGIWAKSMQPPDLFRIVNLNASLLCPMCMH